MRDVLFLALARGGGRLLLHGFAVVGFGGEQMKLLYTLGSEVPTRTHTSIMSMHSA